MTNFFKEIQKNLKNPSPSELTNYLERHKLLTFQDYLLFNGPSNFYNALEALVSEITLTPAEINSLENEHGFKIIAQTIDGDFLAATTEETWVISKNLIVADIERFPYPILDFLVNYEQGTIESKILV